MRKNIGPERAVQLVQKYMNNPYGAVTCTVNPGLRSLRSLRPGLTESAFQAEEFQL